MQGPTRKHNLGTVALAVIVTGVIVSSLVSFEAGVIVLSAGTLLLGYALFTG